MIRITRLYVPTPVDSRFEVPKLSLEEEQRLADAVRREMREHEERCWRAFLGDYPVQEPTHVILEKYLESIRKL